MYLPSMPMGMIELIRRMIPFRVRRFLRTCIRGAVGPSMTDAEIEAKQRRDIQRYEDGNIPPPPKKLQVRVIGLYSPHFIESGWHTFNVFEQALAKAGRPIRSFESVLDFGCGCGRVTRSFRQMSPHAKLFGSDVDGEAIHWLNQNYHTFAEFSVNGPMPPLRFENETFDLIYCISVFTHLPEDMQRAWLAELQRVARRNAIVLLTVYGQKQYLDLNASNRAEFLKRGFYYVHERVSTTEGLPSFYQTAFHSHEYVRSVWGEYFEVLNIEPLAIDSHSDLIVLRKA